jgi:hypothetical protein
MGHCCEERRRLAEQFAINARLYADAVVNLTRMQNMTAEEYVELRSAAEQAQWRTERARAAFEEHVDLHRCWRKASAMGAGE